MTYHDDAEERFGEFYPPEPTGKDLVRDEQIVEKVRALIKAPESVPVRLGMPSHPAEPGKWLAYGPDLTASGSWYVDGETDGNPNIEVRLEIMTEFGDADDAPSDDAVVNLQGRRDDLERQWEAIKGFIHQALENGDPSFLMEASDLIPELLADSGRLLAAINAAIASAEGDHH